MHKSILPPNIIAQFTNGKPTFDSKNCHWILIVALPFLQGKLLYQKSICFLEGRVSSHEVWVFSPFLQTNTTFIPLCLLSSTRKRCTLKGKKLPCMEKMFSYKSWPKLKRCAKIKRTELLPLKMYIFKADILLCEQSLFCETTQGLLLLKADITLWTNPFLNKQADKEFQISGLT